MKKILLTTSLIALQFFCSCKEKITNPPNDTPGRRDYVWTIDTLAGSPWTSMDRLWASSPADLWATGGGGDIDNLIQHFDGTRWTTGITSKYGIYYSPSGVYGFGNDNVYLGTLNGGIWHFDSINFKQINELTKYLHSETVFENLWGDSSNDLYAFGAYGDENGYFNYPVIFHFLNGMWDTLNTDGIRGDVAHLYKNSTDNKIYLIVVRGDNVADSTTIYEYGQGKYYKLYGNYDAQSLRGDISLIDDKVYFVLGNEIAVRVNNQFQTVITVDNPNFYQRIWGRNSKDIFLMMTDGLAHYDGADIQYLIQYGAPSQIFGAALFDNDVFFLVYKPQGGLSLVYHGTLKK
jgi:hypothetical protein